MKLSNRRENPEHAFNLKEISPLFLFMLIGAILRSIRIESRPLWYDEAIAVLVSRNGLGAILRSTVSPAGGTASNVHPPLYFSALWAWMEVFGESPLAVRSLSLILSLGVMALLWGLSSSMFGRRTAVISVALYAFSPFHVHYGQEARMYVLLSFFLLIATWAMWKVLQGRRGAIYWIVLGVASALALYTQILASMYLLTLYGLPLLLGRWRSFQEAIKGGVLALIIYAPWLFNLPGQLNRVQAGYWIDKPGAGEIVQTLIAFNTGLPLSGIWLPIGLGLSIFLFILLAWRTFSLLRSGEVDRQTFAIILILALLPGALLFIVSQVWPVYVIRALIPSGVFYLVWIALLISSEHVRSIDQYTFSVVAAAIFMIGLFNQYTYRGFPYAPFEELDAYLEERAAGDGVILHSNKITMLPAYYYDQELPHTFLADIPGSGSDTLAAPTQKVIGISAEPDVRSATAGRDWIFFVIFEREIEDYQQSGIDIHPTLKYLQGHFEEVSYDRFGELMLYEFIRQDG